MAATLCGRGCNPTWRRLQPYGCAPFSMMVVATMMSMLPIVKSTMRACTHRVRVRGRGRGRGRGREG